MRYLVLLLALGCTKIVPDESLTLQGTLDRESIEDSAEGQVDVDFTSSPARGEWWPCDLRLTSQACIGEHHVNVFLSLPEVSDFALIGGTSCVQDGVPFGLLEVMQQKGRGTYTIGADISAFVLVASDTDDAPGVLFNSDAETTAATRITAGAVTVTGLAGRDGITLTMDFTTADGHEVTGSFSGPTSLPAVVPTIEGPSTCVAAPQ